MPPVEVDGYKCNVCGALVSDDVVVFEEHLYECGTDGLFVAESSRCEQCNKFSRKIEDIACTECREGGLELVGTVWQIEEQVFETREEAVAWEAGKEERLAARRSKAEESEAYLAEFRAREFEKDLALIKRLSAVVRTLRLLAATCPEDQGLAWTSRGYEAAHEKYLAGDVDGAVSDFRNPGLSITLNRATFVTICELVPEAD